MKSNEVSLNCLVVDDDDIQRSIIANILEKLKIKSIMASNGADAVEKVFEHTYIDIGIIDLQMPIMNGQDAIKIIQEINEFPIIVMTGNDNYFYHENYQYLKYDHFLIKPVDIDKLSKIICDVLKKYKNKSERILAYLNSMP